MHQLRKAINLFELAVEFDIVEVVELKIVPDDTTQRSTRTFELTRWKTGLARWYTSDVVPLKIEADAQSNRLP